MTTTTADLRTVLLHARYPCCGQGSRITAVEAVPRETYDRTCRRCGAVWVVRRRTLPVSDFAASIGARVDRLEWERQPEETMMRAGVKPPERP